MNQIAFFKIYLINKQEMAIPIEIRRENLILGSRLWYKQTFGVSHSFLTDFGTFIIKILGN